MRSCDRSLVSPQVGRAAVGLSSQVLAPLCLLSDLLLNSTSVSFAIEYSVRAFYSTN